MLAIVFVMTFAQIGPNVVGQQIGVGTPFNSYGDSYYERMGVNFGFSFPGGRSLGGGSRIVGLLPNGQLNPGGNLVFGQNSFGSALPAFGGYDPQASARFGFNSIGRGGGGFSLGLEMGKGSSRTVTSSAPHMIVQNGMGGSMFSGELRPFVTGLIPINGTAVASPPVNGVTLARDSGQLDLSQLGDPTRDRSSRTVSGPPMLSVSSANQAVGSVDSIRMRKKLERERMDLQMASLLDSCDEAIEANDYSTARSHLRAAIGLEEDEQRKSNLKMRLKSLQGK
jgi:hypothetical protein